VTVNALEQEKSLSMTAQKVVKCASKEFKAIPFYLIQAKGSDKRFVVSFQDGEKIKLFLSKFIDESADSLQVKIRDFEDHENPVDFTGKVTKEDFKVALNEYEDVIIHDGYHDLMIRRPETGDYIAFDEHGLIFIYTQYNYSTILEDFGLTYKADEKLIYQFDHWHCRSANGRNDLNKLVKELQLE
jgi:hypothetical protein